MKVKKNQKLILAEIALIVASVFIFQGLWLFWDSIEFMNSSQALLVSIVAGIVVSIPALRYIIRNS